MRGKVDCFQVTPLQATLPIPKGCVREVTQDRMTFLTVLASG